MKKIFNEKTKENISYFFSKKKNIFILISILVIVLAIIIGGIVYLKLNKRYSYQEIENMMVESTKQFFSINKYEQPNEVRPNIEVDSMVLQQMELLSDFSKLSRDTNCFGAVNAVYNNGVIRYVPHLMCDKYETQKLIDVIKKNNPIVTSLDGLYEQNEVLLFKGDYVNNYISFANKLWRIFKITNDNKFYLVLADTVNEKNSSTIYDDHYNEEAKAKKGYSDFAVSKIKIELDSIFKNEFNDYKGYIPIHNACSHSRSDIDTLMNGEIECSTTVPSYLSLLSVYDYLNASRDIICTNVFAQNCINYNYLAKTKNKWWLLNGTNEVSYKAYYAGSDGRINLDNTNNKKYLRYVLTLPTDVLFKSGNGTENKPYQIYTNY